jgi:hypothetical protein
LGTQNAVDTRTGVTVGKQNAVDTTRTGVTLGTQNAVNKRQARIPGAQANPPYLQRIFEIDREFECESPGPAINSIFIRVC